MDEQSSPKQLTLTQYTMSPANDDIRCTEEEMDNNSDRAKSIRQVRSAIESNPRIFAWKKQSRNDDITAETNRRNKEIIALDENCSDDDFMPKPQRRYAKPTFTRPPHTTQRSQHGVDLSSDDEVVVAQVIKVCNKKLGRGTKRKKHHQEKRSAPSPFAILHLTDSSDEKTIECCDCDDEESDNEEISHTSTKKKYLSQQEVAEKYRKLLDRNKELERLLRFARKQLAFYRCHMGWIKEQARHPTIDDIVSTPLSDEEVDDKGCIKKKKTKVSDVYLRIVISD